MCRNATEPGYKNSYVCIKDRHVAQYNKWDFRIVLGQYGKPRCPICKEDMLVAGKDFKAPKKKDNKKWKMVEATLALGVVYEGCGCSRDWRPRKISEIPLMKRRKKFYYGINDPMWQKDLAEKLIEEWNERREKRN